jgi:acyl-CoA synthetase (AMP-forming)/AMP-acid ligase II
MPPLFDVVAAHADAHPDSAAILTEQDGIRSYAELTLAAGVLAVSLRHELGLEPGERICLWAVNHPPWVESYLAATGAGLATVAANPEWTDEEIGFVLGHSGAAAVICDAPLAARALRLAAGLPALRHVVAVDLDGEGIAPGAIDYTGLLAETRGEGRLPAHDAQLPALIMYTSGTTTGRPKAVVSRPGAAPGVVGAGGTDYEAMFGIERRDRAIVVTPFFHGNGGGGLRSALNYGASAVFPRRFSARRFWRLVDLYRPTYLFTLSSIANILLGLPPGPHERRHQLRVAIVLGAAASAPVIEERFGVPVIDWYGMTEAGYGTYTRLGIERRPGSAGQRFDGSTMTILAESGGEAAPGEVGEVVFARGSIAFDGYLDDEEATAAVIDRSWFHTGDLGYFDEDGFFFFVDRLKDIVRRGGENISSVEIEGVLRLHPDVADAGIVGRPDPVLGQRVVAFVVPAEGRVPDAAALRAHVAAHLARFKVPEEFVVVEALPRTGTGKVVKAHLRAQLTDPPGAI